MTKRMVGRPKTYDGDAEVSDEAKELAEGLVNSLSTNMQQLARFGNETSMTPRMKQKMASEIMVGLFMQPLYRERYADWALQNPGEAAKIGASQIPKEIHIEQTTQHNVVLLPPGMTGQEWLKANQEVEDVEVIPWLDGKVLP